MFILGFVLGLIVSPFLLIVVLAFNIKPKEPPAKADWKIIE